jgi:glyoxylase-like metal-dependent hydrolase (beta-lactamase superfamily II)
MLFVGGVGAFFEGGSSIVYESIQKIYKLPDYTMIFPGHEYSEMTLKFAKYIESDNKDLIEKCRWVSQRRNKYLATVPSTLAEEKSYNPFLRIGQPSILDKTDT